MSQKKKKDVMEARLDELMRAPRSAAARGVLVQRYENDFDDIYQAYTDPRKRDRLTVTQRRQLARWKFARQWYSDFDPPTDREVVDALQHEYGISARQAYTDVANCKKLFASVDQVNEEFEKVMAIERIKRLRTKSLDLGTAKGFDVAARCDVTLAKILGFDKERAHMPEPKLVQVIMGADPALVGAKPIENLAAVLKGFWKKKEEEKQRQIQDIEHEDIIDNPRNDRAGGGLAASRK